MDGSRDLNISGYKIVNVANPTQPADVVTKNYTDKLNDDMKDYINGIAQGIFDIINKIRDLTPTLNVEEYVRYINLRQVTCHSLAGLLKISTTFPGDRHAVYQHGGPHVWIESPTSSLEYKMTKMEEIIGKEITIDYQKPVKVSTWTLYLLDMATIWRVKFIWQWSKDRVNWISSKKAINTEMAQSLWCGNNAKIVFRNDETPKAYKYWRIVINGSETTTNYMYINYLQMELEYIEETKKHPHSVAV